jgi:hypothetical protein
MQSIGTGTFKNLIGALTNLTVQSQRDPFLKEIPVANIFKSNPKEEK